MAVNGGHEDVVKELLDRGADPDKTDKEGESPMEQILIWQINVVALPCMGLLGAAIKT